MNGLKTFTLGAAGLLLASASFAQDVEKPNTDFIGLSYVYGIADVDVDTGDAALDALAGEFTQGDWYFGEGGQLDVSYGVVDKVLLRGQYYSGSGEYRGGPDIDFTTGLVGVGVLVPTDDAVVIDLSIEYRKDEIELENIDEDLDGVGFSFGVRANIAPEHELGLRVGGYMSDFDQAVGITLGYAWNFSENFGLTAGYEYIDVGVDDSDDVSYTLTKWNVGGRFYF
jgi:hypothetical protein